MRNLFVNVAFLSVTCAAGALACSFQVGTGPKTPDNGTGAATPAPAPTPKPPTTPWRSPAVAHIGHSKVLGGRTGAIGAGGATSTTPAGTTAPAGTTTPPATDPNVPPIMTGANIWGNGTADANAWTGTIYTIPAGATKLPDLNALPVAGFLFAQKIDVAPQAMTGGFPGIDANRNENFAIRFEGPIAVTKEADYVLRVNADDGAVLKVDGMTIVDDDGVHSPAASKSSPVHLVAGTHVFTVDYFQGTGQVALQVFVTPAGGAETILPLHL